MVPIVEWSQNVRTTCGRVTKAASIINGYIRLLCSKFQHTHPIACFNPSDWVMLSSAGKHDHFEITCHMLGDGYSCSYSSDSWVTIRLSICSLSRLVSWRITRRRRTICLTRISIGNVPNRLEFMMSLFTLINKGCNSRRDSTNRVVLKYASDNSACKHGSIDLDVCPKMYRLSKT